MTELRLRWATAVSMAGVWVAGVVLVDVLIGSHVVLAGLFAAGPLLACAFLSPRATAWMAAAAVGLTAVSGTWRQSWDTEQQIFRVANVVIIGAVAVAVAWVRVRRENAYARLVAAEAAARRTGEIAGAQFSAAFDRAPLGVALLDDRQTIVRANAALARLAGREARQLVGVNWADLMMPVERPGDQRDLCVPGADPDRPAVREAQLVTASAGARWVTCRASVVHGVPGVHAVVHVEDIGERKLYQDRLEHLASHDPLTGLYNRRRFYEELTRQAALDRRDGRSSTVLVLDLDGFKFINDTLGHATGDELLQVVARGLEGRLRASDVLGRLGGDEFGVLLPSTDAAEAAGVAAALLENVRAAQVRHCGQRVRCTASIGSAKIFGADEGDIAEVVANADLAMYAAKDAGRDAYVAYDPAGPHAAEARAQYLWLDRIRDALERDGFSLHVQPILDLRCGKVTGAELLLRMRDGDRLVLPDQFLPVADRHGLSGAVDRYVIDRGIRLAAAQARPPWFRWEINLSADSLADPDIPALIRATLAETGLTPSCLVFEITETAAIANMESARAFAERIIDIGCDFALDDFGAGYGSFYWLKHLPARYLKIDGEFIRNITASEVDRVIVEAVVDAARRLGKQTIAEYVGDADTLELVRRLEVDLAQGFHIGRPVELRGGP